MPGINTLYLLHTVNNIFSSGISSTVPVLNADQPDFPAHKPIYCTSKFVSSVDFSISSCLLLAYGKCGL